MWRVRNETEAGFRGISDISGKAAFLYLAPRVDAAAHGTNRYEAVLAASREDAQWELSVQQADDEHWRRATAIFREHPYLTAYSFVRSATEHAIHPSPDVLAPARLRFRGDFFVLGIIWAALLLLAALGCLCSPDPSWDDGEINRRWLLTLLAICLFLTLLSGISFAAGSRLRAPLELIVPLLAAIGLVRGIRAVTFAVRLRMA